jgi:sulfate adenylyltransferase subunit 1
MTSACGVVENLSEKTGSSADKASFQYGALRARGDIFEEFYYDTSSLNVLKYQPVNSTYTVGDEIPVSGESYHYPESFDIIVLRDSVAVSVRNRKITAIVPTSGYVYGGVPIINGRGFEVLADSEAAVQDFLREYAAAGDEQKEFFAKWVRFETYRKVIFPASN